MHQRVQSFFGAEIDRINKINKIETNLVNLVNPVYVLEGKHA